MAELSTRREIALIEELTTAAAERHAEERRIEEDRRAALADADRRRDGRRRDVESGAAAERETIDNDFAGRRAMLEASHEAERARSQDEYRALRTKAEAQAALAAEEAARKQKDAAWEITTVFDTTKHRPAEKLKETRDRLAQRHADLAAIAGDAVAIARNRGVEKADFVFEPPKRPAAEATPTETPDGACEQAETTLASAVEAARDAAQSLYDQRLPNWVGGPLPVGVLFGLMTIAIPLGGMTLGWTNWLAYAIGVGLPALAATAVTLGLAPKARRQTREGFSETESRLREAEAALAEADRLAVARSRWERHELERVRDESLAEIGYRYDRSVGEARTTSQAEVDEISQTYPAMLAEMRARHAAAVEEMDRDQSVAVAELTERTDRRRQQIDSDHAADAETIDEEAESAWQAMFARWLTRFDDVRAELRDLRAECQRLFPDFATTRYAAGPAAEPGPGGWNPPEAAPDAIAFGEFDIELARIEHGLSQDDRLHPPDGVLHAPALMTLAEHPTLLITAEGDGRAVGVGLLRSMMLRFLTAMPPGKVRFTIIDPVGLGENFQAFMHLADADEQLIAGRIWSESRDIEEQLGRLTNHMETVLQKYLRSEYETIQEYNAQAGEVAEPFQVLVIAGFPNNFSEAAGKRLVSLVTGGPRCGVYTMLGVDNAARLPTDFRLDELKRVAAWLDWRADEATGASRFVWADTPMESMPLRLAHEPPSERVIDVLKAAGAAAKDAVRVEVPFSVVEPSADDLWRRTCDEELRVPVGRSGAKSLQDVRLGKGTSQHLLVAGKTGSGKSTFLHALVTSAAMHFSPDEVEFYLVDFKKGVEFKSYATHRLPHARVIAIESEREFGLSVLERLDKELRVRGERFRAEGVQNLADYRRARPGEKTPRVLLIVDEFQELFVEDDRLAQEASLLMDRLVRQGRAFGLHVVLGTQTLAGAYSIARSTLGQIAIRVALECSEADAHLILSDERNTAARFLSRPGEAIYNAQNGLLTANEPFQVVWLPDRERAGKLDAIDDLRHRRDLPRPETIVFEGNAPADPLRNRPLADLLAGEAPPRRPGVAPPAWIGAAVAIKPPTSVEFGRHPGANLLVVGPQETAAIGMLSAAVVSLAAAEPAARFVVLDGTRPGEEHEGLWARVAEAIDADVRVVGARDADAAIRELAELAATRESIDPGAAAEPPVYLLLHNAGRFRGLRRNEDDFGFSMSGGDEPKRVDQLFADLLKNGPAGGVHTLVWCDSYNSATRLLDRQLMREFALRVALQMSAADSSNLLDSPAASDLQIHRALLYSDETGQTEKFRPYGPPSEEWLDRVKAAATQRA